MTINQRRAYTEMLEILNNMSLEFKSKIPESLIEKMKTEQEKEWKFQYDQAIALENQKILHETKALFSYIYTTYIATQEKRKELQDIYEKNSKTKYNPDNLFKRKNMSADQENINANVVVENNLTIMEEKWYKKLFNKIKNIFKKNK